MIECETGNAQSWPHSSSSCSRYGWDSFTATFSISGKSGPLPAGLTILEAAEGIGVEIDNACRSGTCGSCKVRLKSGSVTMEVDDALSDQDKEDGMILGCQATSDADVTVKA